MYVYIFVCISANILPNPALKIFRRAFVECHKSYAHIIIFCTYPWNETDFLYFLALRFPDCKLCSFLHQSTRVGHRTYYFKRSKNDVERIKKTELIDHNSILHFKGKIKRGRARLLLGNLETQKHCLQKLGIHAKRLTMVDCGAV